MIRFLARWLLTFILLSLLGVAGVIGGRFWRFSQNTITLAAPQTITIHAGEKMGEIARTLQEHQLGGDSWQWVLLAKMKRADRSIKAGDYLLSGSITPTDVLDKMVRGEVLLQEVRVPEGKSLREILASLGKNSLLDNDVANLSEQAVAEKLQAPSGSLEGWLYPETYRVLRGTKVSDILRMSFKTMQKRVAESWAERDPGIAAASMEEALILASIVEKEAGPTDDRGLIASVFDNRLKANMPLQSDPTVIYGMGVKFKGNLTRNDLQTPTAYNTYTIPRLPPTPIASVSMASLQAVLHPPQTAYYYFVAQGNGSSAFSRNLAEHNQAVNTYQRGRK